VREKEGERERAKGWREEIHGVGFPRVAIHLARYIFAYTHARSYSKKDAGRRSQGDGGCARWRTRSLIFIRAMKHGAAHSLAKCV